MIQIYLLHNTKTFGLIKILTDNKTNLQTRMLTILIHPRYIGKEDGNHKNCFICILFALSILKKKCFLFSAGLLFHAINYYYVYFVF